MSNSQPLLKVSLKNGIYYKDSPSSISHPSFYYELQLFGLVNFQKEKKIASDFFESNIPASLYFIDPTPPYGNLFTTHNWDPTTTTIETLFAEKVSESLTSVTLENSTFTNFNSTAMPFSPPITSAQLEYSFSSSWSKDAERVWITGPVQVCIEDQAPTEIKINLIDKWNAAHSEGKSIQVPIKAEGVEVAPFNTAVANLIAEKVDIVYRITYLVRISGSVGLVFNQPVNNSKFWNLKIEYLEYQAGLPTYKIVTQDITVTKMFNPVITMAFLPIPM